MRIEFPQLYSLDTLMASKRILILGSPGSGKTFLSIRLGQYLGIEPLHLDKCFWQPGWVPTPQNEWRKKVSALVAKPAWIMDGTYESTLDLRLPACETIIVVERGPVLCTWGVIRRKLTIDDAHRPDAPAGQPIDYAFLRYIWLYPFVTRPLVNNRIQEFGREKHLIVVNGTRGINALLGRVNGWEKVLSPDSTRDHSTAQTE